jgi:hypothetical protein
MSKLKPTLVTATPGTTDTLTYFPESCDCSSLAPTWVIPGIKYLHGVEPTGMSPNAEAANLFTKHKTQLPKLAALKQHA